MTTQQINENLAKAFTEVAILEIIKELINAGEWNSSEYPRLINNINIWSGSTHYGASDIIRVIDRFELRPDKGDHMEALIIQPESNEDYVKLGAMFDASATYVDGKVIVEVPEAEKRMSIEALKTTFVILGISAEIIN